jgi:hypothetical protein
MEWEKSTPGKNPYDITNQVFLLIAHRTEIYDTAENIKADPEEKRGPAKNIYPSHGRNVRSA